jgi:signal peptidase II
VPPDRRLIGRGTGADHYRRSAYSGGEDGRGAGRRAELLLAYGHADKPAPGLAENSREQPGRLTRDRCRPEGTQNRRICDDAAPSLLPLLEGTGVCGQSRSARFRAACHTGLVAVNARCAAVLVGTALLGIGLDQGTKALVAATREGKPPIRVVGHVLTIYVTRNSGAAFGSAPGATVLFTGVAVATAVLVAIKAPRLRSAGWAAALGLVLAGAIGNLCDRLLRAPGIGRGAVVDFIDLQHFADFNIADSCLTCGVVLIVLLSLRGIHMTGDERPSVSATRPIEQ